jgi:hypothetical protein
MISLAILLLIAVVLVAAAAVSRIAVHPGVEPWPAD